MTGNVGAPAPTLHQPLSHGAERRDSSPFRGADGWEEVCGDGASVYRDADTYVSLTPVRGGVLDAPRSDYYRGGFVAPVRRGRFYPRFPRCTRICLPPSVCDFAGTARAPFFTGEPTSSVHPRRAGVEARPYGGLLRGLTDYVGTPHQRCANPSVTAQSAATAPLLGEPRAWVEGCTLAHLFTAMRILWFSSRP